MSWPIKSYTLSRDKEKCIKCWECARILPEYLVTFHGRLVISESNYKQEHVRLAVDEVVNCCEGDAIQLVESVK